MARIVFCANTTWNVANFRLPIIDALLTRGDEVVVVAAQDNSDCILKERGCKTVHLSVDAKGSNPLRDLMLIFNLRRCYAGHRPDVVLNFTIKPVIYSTFSARLTNIPVINTITGLGTVFVKDTWLTRIVLELYRRSLPGQRPVVFQNEDDLALFRLQRLVTTNPVTIVPGSGVDLKKFCMAPIPRTGSVTFLLIARLIKDKGIGEFVQAARALRASYPHARFQLLGPLGVANRRAVSPAELAHWVGEGVIEYLGATDDVRPFIEQAHCIVLPSYYREGMPRVLLEAAAMGRPLIAADVTGSRDVIRHGVNGYLCSPRESTDLAAKMRTFIDLPYSERRKMGEASRTMAEENFDIRKVVETYLALIDTEIANARQSQG